VELIAKGRNITSGGVSDASIDTKGAGKSRSFGYVG